MSQGSQGQLSVFAGGAWQGGRENEPSAGDQLASGPGTVALAPGKNSLCKLWVRGTVFLDHNSPGSVSSIYL